MNVNQDIKYEDIKIQVWRYTPLKCEDKNVNILK